MFRRNITLILIFAFLISGCSAARMTAQDGGEGVVPAQPPMAIPEAAPEEVKGRELDNSGSFVGGVESAPTDRLVIKNATLTIVVVDPSASLSFIGKMAEEMGGFVVTSNLYKSVTENGEEFPQANITVRVPAERLTEALDQIKAQTEKPEEDVRNENVNGEDVTQTYTDLQSRLRNLEQAEEQLREILASATRPEDVLNVFNQLTSVREQIEVLKGQIQYYEEAAALSAINVSLLAQEAVAPLTIGRWQPVGVARDAVQALINTLKFVGNAIIWIAIYALPVLAVLFLVIFLPLRLLWRALRKSKTRPLAPPPAPTPSA